MATKTFKIGLSNTDKQNMAQEVYERLLALTFPEYDTTTSYDVGDFVVYNDQLYKCIGATSGAWDSSKWQLATLNDLLTDIEDAVAFVNDKANVDGNYPTMTVGVADQLSPYDDESGDDQDEPFSFQATGTGNGTQPDFSTGAIALMKEKQGNTVVVNQQAKVIENGFTSGGITFTVSNGVIDANGTATEDMWIPLVQESSLIAGHKYILFGNKQTTVNGEGDMYIFIGDGQYAIDNGTPVIFTSSITSDQQRINFEIWNGKTANHLKYSPVMVDLTQMFNGDIPQDLLDNPENFFRYYQGSLAYNEGELVNANGRYIKCIGRNQWDEEWENGHIDVDGTLVPDNSYIRSKNYIKVIPNTTYFIKVPAGSAHFFYDKDQNYLGYGFAQNTTFTTPANCCYIKFHCSVATYNHDITISLYYEGESGYDQYYPYEVLTNNDTGTEVLRSAGSVHDIKKPDGSIVRNVGYVDLGDLAYQFLDQSSLPHHFNATPSPEMKGETLNVLLSNGYQLENVSHVLMNNKTIRTETNGSFTIRDDDYSTLSDFKTAMSGVYLFYELATPTTEQGTPYSENLVIDDFGSMDFSGTNGVPQGNLIFYPVDYKAFIDTLYDYTEGTPSDIALKSDLASDKSELQGVDTQLLNAIGGTLRQCLCVKESLDFDNTDFVDLGDFSWNGSNGDFNTGTTFGRKTGAECKGMSTRYVVYGTYSSYASASGNRIGLSEDGTMYVHDTNYTSADTLKASLKGVLLAYEKGE